MEIVTPVSFSSPKPFNNFNFPDFHPITLADFLNSKDWEEEGIAEFDDQLSMDDDDDVKRREDCKSLSVILSSLLSVFRRKKKKKRNGQERIVAVVERERKEQRLDGVSLQARCSMNDLDRKTGAAATEWPKIWRKKKKKRNKRNGQETIVAVVERERREQRLNGVSLQARCSMNDLDRKTGAAATEEEAGVESQVSCDSGSCKKEALVNMGIGFGLLYLLAMSKNELNQMIELRKQMEIIFQNGKKELDLHRKDALAMPSIYNNNNEAYTTTNFVESVNSNDCLSLQTYSTSDISGCSERTTRPAKPVNEDIFREEECVENIHRLEAEFEAELECLQLRLDTDILFAYHHEEKIEVDVEDIDSEGSLTASYEEVIDEQEAYAEKEHGVCPYELKIRLLELIQEKHKERIKELDAALEHAQKKLVEKEIELS